jgi:hypothetical protein
MIMVFIMYFILYVQILIPGITPYPLFQIHSHQRRSHQMVEDNTRLVSTTSPACCGTSLSWFRSPRSGVRIALSSGVRSARSLCWFCGSSSTRLSELVSELVFRLRFLATYSRGGGLRSLSCCRSSSSRGGGSSSLGPQLVDSQVFEAGWLTYGGGGLRSLPCGRSSGRGGSSSGSSLGAQLVDLQGFEVGSLTYGGGGFRSLSYSRSGSRCWSSSGNSL